MTAPMDTREGLGEMTKCFACDRTIKNEPRVLTCLDEQTVHVGPCCFAKAENAGLDGYQPSKGGPRLYTLEAKARLLACDCQHPEPTPDGFAAVSFDCPVHNSSHPSPELSKPGATARISELDDASNACLELAAKHGYATGHGDTVADMIREFSAQIPSPELPAGARAVEDIAQWLHDETNHPDSYPSHTWPETERDDGQREGGFVKIVPAHGQAYFREITRLRKGLEEIKRYLEEREPRVGDALFACEALLAR